MPESKRRIVKPYEPPPASESTVEFTGVEATIYRCPICGVSGEDIKLIEGHIAAHPKPEAGEDA